MADSIIEELNSNGGQRANPSKDFRHGNERENYLPAANSAVKRLSASPSSISMQRGNSHMLFSALASNNASAEHTSQTPGAMFEDVEQSLRDYRLRSYNVIFGRYAKTLEHVSNFMRVFANVRIENSKGQIETTKVAVVIERKKTIEDLSREIEAEYAFSNVERTMQNSSENPESLVMCVNIVALYDVGGVPLKYDSLVSDVLNSGDEINVVGATIGNGNNSDLKKSVQYHCRSFDLFLDHIDNTDNLQAIIEDKHLLAEVQCHVALHNLVLNQYFQDYCFEAYEIECLLFWLEIEVFRGFVREARRITAPSQGSADSIEPTNPMFQTITTYCRYIYLTYLTPKSSLALNIPKSLLRNVSWPLAAISSVTQEPQPLKTSMFDDIHLHIFYYLAHFVYPKFMQSKKYQEFQQVKAKDHNLSNNMILPGTHKEYFPQDISEMANAVQEMIQRGLDTDLLNNDDAKTQNVLDFLSPKLQDREEYYGNGPRITTAQRLRRVQREKKLKKFFGDQPKQDDDYVESKTARLSEKTTGKDLNLLATVDSQHDSNATNAYELLHNIEESDNVVESDDGHERKKRAGKLEEFFGSRLPKEMLFEQKLIANLNTQSMSLFDQISEIEQKEFLKPAPSTVNELSSEAKRFLMKRNKKLTVMFGEKLDEEIQANWFKKQNRVITDSSIESAQLIPESVFVKESFDDTTVSNGPVGLVPRANRRQSFSSQLLAEANTSGNSLSGLSGTLRKNRETREYKRKKLEKIQQFLGERITQRVLQESSDKNNNVGSNSSTPLDPKLRQVQMRRVNKLQTVFGEVVPTESLASAIMPAVSDSDADLYGDNAFEPLANFLGVPVRTIFEIFLSNEDDIADFLSLMRSIDAESGRNIANEIVDEDEDDQNDLDDVQEEAEEMNNNENEIKRYGLGEAIKQETIKHRHRKRIGKLTKFFGSTAGQVSNQVTIDEKIANVLQEHLKDLVDPTVIRDIIKARSDKGTAGTEMVQNPVSNSDSHTEK